MLGVARTRSGSDPKTSAPIGAGELMNETRVAEIEAKDWHIVLDEHIAEALEVALPKPDERTNVNAKPVYVGKWMILSDQDMTALKHHVLSSAVMGTVFASLIVTLSDPTIPLVWRACLLGGILTGLQALMVAVSNVGILCWEGKAVWLGACRRGVVALFDMWSDAHTVHLSNGATVWVDEYGYSVVLDDGGNNAA